MKIFYIVIKDKVENKTCCELGKETGLWWVIIWEGYEEVESKLLLLRKGKMAPREGLRRLTCTRPCRAGLEEVLYAPIDALDLVYFCGLNL